MRLNKYIFFSILLMLIIGGFVYSQIDAKYTFNLFGIPITLPVAVWIVVPMFIMFLASFFHMAYYSFINFMVLKRYKKDYDILVKSFANALLREPKINKYKSTEAKNLGNITDHSHIIPQDFRIETKDERLKRALDYVKDITNGIYVDISNYTLSPSNPLTVQNIKNRLKEEPTYSGVVLKNCDEYPKELCKEALQVYMGFSEVSKIKEYAKIFDFSLLLYMLEAKKDEAISHTDIIYILQQASMQLTIKEYLVLAQKTKDVLAPDERLKLFEILKNEDEKSEAAYVYTLLDLEMIDKALEFLDTVPEGELENFKAYLELKECGKNYPLELFICI
ncbi:hypothetical protein [Nitratiruptor sp. YY09-18]|uniref:hypothetical protein n=1 Tax=Nitratiruptor sp. YY09-18 TaxID=2724901 RepID=UPI001916ACDC|nr:hypothetical protein [Nitratiruptor sp. YY09-18]BCD67805.1 hypothetical protein NitYY0918_C0712 [Nitratiruptor sp. YY09-18]